MRLRVVSSGIGGWRGVLIALLLVGSGLLVLASLSRAAACDETWNGSTSTDWNTAANWTPASVPTQTQNVCIPAGSFTVALTGSGTADSLTIGAGDTVAVTATQTSGAALSLYAGSTNSGTLKLTDSATTASNQEARVLIETGATLTNDGTILSDPGPNAEGTRAIDGQSSSSALANSSSGTITVNQDLQINSGQDGLFTTNGNITIASGQRLLVDPSGAGIGGNPAASSSEMDIDGGTITVNGNGAFDQGISETGSIESGAALKVNGGTITGGPLTVVSGTYTDEAGTGVGASLTGGSGTYEFIGSGGAGATTLAGTIGSSQTVILSASTADGGAPVQINSNVTNDGTIQLTDSDTSGTNQNQARILIGPGQTLTNDGTITATGVHGQRAIDGQSSTSTLANATGGTIDAAADLQVDTTQTGTFTTSGTITVPAGGTFQADPNGGNATFNLNGGSVTNNGTFELGINSGGGAAAGTAFNVNGASVTGNPIVAAGATTTFSGNGNGSFTLEGGNSTLAGTIAAGDNVSLSGSTSGAGSVSVQTSGAVVNDGTFTMTDPDTSPSASAFAELEIPSSSTFTNDGTMISAPGPDGSGYRSIDGTLDNAGTLNVNMLLQLALHSVSNLDNSGTVDVAPGQGLFILGASDAYTQSAGTTSLGGGATMSVAGVILQGGSLTGSGTLCGPGGNQAAPCGSGATATALTNGGTISPSPTPSTITVDGGYTQASSGTLDVGITSTGNDQLNITGSSNTATLDGTLNVSTASGFTPPVGQQYQILNAPGGVSGQFATTNGTGPYTITYNPTNVTLTSAVAAPAASFNPTSITFGSPSSTVATGSTVNQTLTVTNSGHAPLTLGTLSLSGPQSSSFSITQDQCSGKTIAAGGQCTASLNFKPTGAGTDSAQVNVPDNASGSPQTVLVTGYAGAAGARASLSTASLDFGPVGVGVTSAAQTVTVTSTGSGPLQISSVGLAGADAGDYNITSDTCAGHSLAPGGSCSTSVTITAAGTGSRVANLLYGDNAPGSPQAVALSGTGTTSGTLTGRVLNGAILASPPPLAGASVVACPFGHQTGCQSATAGSSGAYSISGLRPGAWAIQVEPPSPYLFAGGSVLQIVPGLNTHDYTLTPPTGLSGGISINGQTSGVGYSYWTSPATVQAPITVPTSGPAGVVGATVVQFWAQPLSGTGGAPYAVGAVAIYYQFNAGGAPVFIGMDQQPFPTGSGQGPSIGTWMTSVATKASPYVPVAGETVAGYSAQGDFVPPPGGPDYHGAFLYEIHQWSLFASPSAAGAHDVRATLHTAQAGAPSTLIEAERCLRASNGAPPCDPNPSPPPGGCPTPSSPPFTFFNQSYASGGIFDLGDGATWNAETKSLALPGGAQFVISGGTITLYQPFGNPLGSNPLPGSQISGVTTNADGSISYDGFTFYPNGTVLDPGGTKYDPQGEPISGPSQNTNCKPNYNYWHNVTGWQDPSGTVMSTKHIPVPGATVLLTRSTRHAGPFTKVPNGSLFMSPSNRRNPDHTTALGQFGWDVVPGFYRVSARHAGCTAARGGASVFSSALQIPPAVTNVRLTLNCPHLRRSISHTKLKARKMPVNEIALVAVVRGRRPQGIVVFEHNGGKVGTVTLNPRTGRAVFSVSGASTKGFRAVYEGDGYNAPSSGTG